jgi:hypothetical protein
VNVSIELSRLRSLALGALLALGLLVAGRQITATGWYSENGAYRAQVDALLAGRLALSEAPEAMQHDLAWTEHGVQQVWGLGVPLWQAPFELVGRAIGLVPFPDRVALWAWLALAFMLVIRAWWRRDEPWLGTGCVVIAALVPPIVTLVRGRLGVYEEAALYAYAGSMILLAGTQRVSETSGRVRYLVLLAAAGASGFLRPTVWFYGLATAVVASMMFVRAHGRRGIATVVLGAVLFAAGGAALYATNARRFGDGMEFGHRLNLESLPGNLIATRFSYPFQRVSFGEAAREELGAMFDRPERRGDATFYGRALHVGQSQQPRWREYYFTTFTWGYVPVLLAGLVLGVIAWRRRDRAGPERWLLPWAVLGGGPLFVFYLHSPSMSSRYQLDLAPAFVALILIAWRALARRAKREVALGVLALAWGASVALAQPAKIRGIRPVGRDEAAVSAYAMSRVGAHPRVIPPAYDLTDPWVCTDTADADRFDRCIDEAGAAIDPGTIPLGGEHCLHGERLANDQWVVLATAVRELPPEVCELEQPVCPVEPTAANTGEIVDVIVPPPPLYLNMFRWDLVTGEVPPATLVWLDSPEFVELDVTTLHGKDADWEHDIRVVVGRTPLHLAAISDTNGGVRLRFEGGPLPRGLTVAFLAFGPDTNLANARSRFSVRRIAWR